MTWRIVTSDSAWADLERLDDHERLVVRGHLHEWVDTAPPMLTQRQIGDVVVYQDILISGHGVTYFVDESVPYAAVLRIRKLR